MTKEEFERRVGVVLTVAEQLSLSESKNATEPPQNEMGMTRGEALAFYERLVEDLDACLEKMMESWEDPLPTYTGKKDSGQG